MARRKPLPQETFAAHIDSLTHDARGVAHVDGKAVFIDGALPGEDVQFRYTSMRRKHDEGEVVAVDAPSPDRVEPRCAHFAVCGGCSLQHLGHEAQVGLKERQLLEDLRRIGKVEPESLLPPLTGPAWGYRRKARLGVKHVVKKGKVLVGFRERRSGFLADLSRCEVLHPSVGERLEDLAVLVRRLSVFERLPQIEVAVGDNDTALVFRHLDPLTPEDEAALAAFGEAHSFLIYLQPAGPDSIRLLWPEKAELTYRLPGHDVELAFRPSDFTQVNADINRAMVDQALRLLDPQPNETVLDLFCGLGNFTLPLARRAAHVTGVEGEAGLVQRARDNAARNGITNAEFYVADLSADFIDQPWGQRRYDKMLLDPARSGAELVTHRLEQLGPSRIVYVSCNPSTLARDASKIVHNAGYRLVAAGIMDMFPHTTHVESMAVFEKDR